MKCVACDVAYTTYGKFEFHMKKHHHRALVCDDCGKRFTMPNTLKRHRLNYHTQFPKTCDDCGHYCATKEDFKAHLATVHGIGTQENTVPCEICGKLLKSKLSLKTHIKYSHTNKDQEYPCDQCGKVFGSKITLGNHLKTHTADMPYRCDECGNGYLKVEDMQVQRWNQNI